MYRATLIVSNQTCQGHSGSSFVPNYIERGQILRIGFLVSVDDLNSNTVE